MRWNRLSGLVFIVASALLLTSCFTIEIESDFEEDGSGFHVYQATIERQALEDLGELADEAQFEDDFDESAEAARQLGYEAERIDTEEHFGVRISRHYDNSENVGRILNSLLTVGADEPLSGFDGTFTRDGNTYTLNLTVDGNALFSDDLESEEGISPAMLSAFITLTYTVRMPGELDLEATNGRVLPDNRVQWDLPLSGVETFTAVSETEDDGVGLLVLIVVIALLFLFIGGAAGLALFLYLRSRRTPPQPPPADYAVDPDAPTRPYPHVGREPDRTPGEDS